MAAAGSLINKDYFREHFLKIYLEDAIDQMFSTHQESNESPTMKPCKFLKEYFTSVHQGTHVLFREFSFISATPYNRLSVLKAIFQIYKPFILRDVRYTAKDYYSALQLVWPDFPVRVVQDAFSVYDSIKKSEGNRIKFLDFVKAMKKSFCTGEFDAEATIIHNQVENKIDEFSSNPTQRGKKLNKADFLMNFDDDVLGKQWKFGNKILDGSKFKRTQNLNNSSFVSSNGEMAGGMLSRSSSESKEVFEKTEKKKRGTKGKTRESLIDKHLPNSFSLLQSGIGDDAEKGKSRHRSKSAVQINQKKPWK